MKKRYRIKKNSEIDAIFKKKVVKGDSYFAIYQSEDPANENFRFALSIGRRYGGAVERNLAKRRIRMIIQEMKDEIVAKSNFVIVIKPSAIDLSYAEMQSKLQALLKKSKLTEKEHE